MKQLLLGLMCFLAFSAQAQKNEPSTGFIKMHAFYVSHGDVKSEGLSDAGQWINNWSQWNDENITDLDLSYLYDFIQPTEQFQHFKVGSSPYVITVRPHSYIQRLYQRSLMKQNKK